MRWYELKAEHFAAEIPFTFDFSLPLTSVKTERVLEFLRTTRSPWCIFYCPVKKRYAAGRRIQDTSKTSFMGQELIGKKQCMNANRKQTAVNKSKLQGTYMGDLPWIIWPSWKHRGLRKREHWVEAFSPDYSTCKAFSCTHTSSLDLLVGESSTITWKDLSRWKLLL